MMTTIETHFIKLTPTRGSAKVWLNIAHIASFELTSGGLFTELNMYDGFRYSVMETPEDIYGLIYSAQS